MVTFHEIKQIIQKMAALSSYIGQLGQLLPQVIQLTEQIGNINNDLTLERDRITAKMRSVEILGEILKTQVFQSPDSAQRGAASEAPINPRTGSTQSTAPFEGGSRRANTTREMSDESSQRGFLPGINSGPLMF